MQNHKFNLKKLASDILAKRTKENISFAATAKAPELKNKIHPATLQRVEAATQMPSAETFAAICNWLNKPVSIYF